MVSLKKKKNQTSQKAFRIPLKHALYQDGEICLFVKDKVDKVEEVLFKNPVPQVKKVMRIDELRADFKKYSLKLQLCQAYDLFGCDSRILPLMTHLLGKHFFRRKKQPFAINMRQKLWPKEVAQMVTSTYMFQSAGNTRFVKIGRSSFTADEITENIMFSMDRIAKKVPLGGWR